MRKLRAKDHMHYSITFVGGCAHWCACVVRASRSM